LPACDKVTTKEIAMPSPVVVEETNQDDLSRKAGCYLYCETQIWLEDDRVHRGDGPAVVSPDGSVRWYLNGKEVSLAVNTFFYENRWPLRPGLDTDEKRALFKAKFAVA
jgi:hypothetical protein